MGTDHLSHIGLCVVHNTAHLPHSWKRTLQRGVKMRNAWWARGKIMKKWSQTIESGPVLSYINIYTLDLEKMRQISKITPWLIFVSLQFQEWMIETFKSISWDIERTSYIVASNRSWNDPDLCILQKLWEKETDSKSDFWILNSLRNAILTCTLQR